jgi:hypothetical protein
VAELAVAEFALATVLAIALAIALVRARTCNHSTSMNTKQVSTEPHTYKPLPPMAKKSAQLAQIIGYSFSFF